MSHFLAWSVSADGKIIAARCDEFNNLESAKSYLTTLQHQYSNIRGQGFEWTLIEGKMIEECNE